MKKTRRKLTCILLNVRRQSYRATYCRIPGINILLGCDMSIHLSGRLHVSGQEVFMGTLFSAQFCSEPKKKEFYLKTELYPDDEIKSKRTGPWIGESHFAGWEEKFLSAAHPIHSHFSIQPTETNLGDSGRGFFPTCVGHIRHGPEGFGLNPSSAILWFRVCHFSKLRCSPNLWRLNDHICSTAL